MATELKISKGPDAWAYMLSAAICRQAADDYIIGYDCTGVELFYRGNLFAAMAPKTDPEAVISSAVTAEASTVILPPEAQMPPAYEYDFSLLT